MRTRKNNLDYGNLQPRQLMAADVFVNDGVLSALGSDDAEVITISYKLNTDGNVESEKEEFSTNLMVGSLPKILL